MSGPLPYASRNLSIIELWKTGISGSQIAVRLGIPSRNAVIGVMFREFKRDPSLRRITDPASRKKHYGGHGGRKPAKPFTSAEARRAARKRWDAALVGIGPMLSPEPPLPTVALPAGINWHASGGCCYITNEDMRAPQWCNVPIVEKKESWCPEHCRLVYRHVQR